jgi:hypothetical protein
MLKNRRLAIVLAIVAAIQTLGPIALQKSTRAIVYHDALHAAIVACLLAAVAIAIWQAISHQFSIMAVVAFNLGLGILIAFDVWIEYAIGASV